MIHRTAHDLYSNGGKVRNSFLVVHSLGPDMLRTNKNYLGTFKARCYHLLCCLRKNFVPCLRVEL